MFVFELLYCISSLYLYLRSRPYEVMAVAKSQKKVVCSSVFLFDFLFVFLFENQAIWGNGYDERQKEVCAGAAAYF